MNLVSLSMTVDVYKPLLIHFYLCLQTLFSSSIIFCSFPVVTLTELCHLEIGNDNIYFFIPPATPAYSLLSEYLQNKRS